MFLKIFFIALPIFLVIDMIWLTLLAKDFYSKQIGFLMAKNPNLLAALIFYFLFIVGLALFVIMPSLEKKQLLQALFMGAFFGLVTYSTYDLTNLATVKNWPILVTVIDLIWGTFVSASVSVITYLLIQKFNL
jgi:uncharacterized membrane protein